MASSPTVADGELEAKSIRTVDLRLLSQSELYSLSLCSTTDYNPCRDDDFIIPKIDRSVFNEYVASRKQTYSRITYAPPASSSSRTRTYTRHPPSLNNNSTENSQVVEVIKQLFGYTIDLVIIGLIIPIPYLLLRMFLNRAIWVQFSRKRSEVALGRARMAGRIS